MNECCKVNKTCSRQHRHFEFDAEPTHRCSRIWLQKTRAWRSDRRKCQGRLDSILPGVTVPYGHIGIKGGSGSHLDRQTDQSFGLNKGLNVAGIYLQRGVTANYASSQPCTPSVSKTLLAVQAIGSLVRRMQETGQRHSLTGQLLRLNCLAAYTQLMQLRH